MGRGVGSARFLNEGRADSNTEGTTPRNKTHHTTVHGTDGTGTASATGTERHSDCRTQRLARTECTVTYSGSHHRKEQEDHAGQVETDAQNGNPSGVGVQGAMETHTVTHRAGSHSTGPEQVETREVHPAGSGEGCVSTQAGVTRRRRRVETEAKVALQELERKERQVARRRRRRLKRQRAKHPEGSARKKAEAMEIVGLRRRQRAEEDIQWETEFGGRRDIKRRRIESKIIREEMHGRLVD